MPLSQVRLNKKSYDEQDFLDAGIDHLDAYFVDGGVPPPSVLRQFMATCEATPGAVAVHCKVWCYVGVPLPRSLSLSLSLPLSLLILCRVRGKFLNNSRNNTS